MDLYKSWRTFVNLRDQYELVKSDLEQVNTYLLPGRHLDTTQLLVSSEIYLSKAAKDVMNDVAMEALEIFSSMLYGTLTPPTQIWFELTFDDIDEMGLGIAAKNWMYKTTRAIHKQLHRSNFYSKIKQFFKELGGYCTAAIKCNEAMESDLAVNFEFIPTGAYLFRLKFDGGVGDFFRIYWKTPVQIYEKYGELTPDILIEKVESGGAAAHDDEPLIEHTFVLDEPTKEGYTCQSVLYYPVTADKTNSEFHLLKDEYHYEMPYFVLKAEENETTEWGAGPGLHAMADIVRLQEIERTEAFAMHKVVDPPLLASNRLEHRLKTLPGAFTFVDMNPAMQTHVESLYKVPIDLEAPFRKIQRIEEQIKRKFYNDVFFTMSRDPNLSPLKAAEVNVRESDKYIRLGPLVSGAYSEMLEPMISRIFNICIRRFGFGLPPVIPAPGAELVAALNSGQFAGSYSVELTSPLAKQQNMAALMPIRTLIESVGALAAVKDTAIDNFNADAAYREIATLLGAPPELTNAPDNVAQTRKARYEAQQAQQAQQAQMLQMEMQIKQNESQAKIASEMSKVQSNMRRPGGEENE